MVGFDPNKVVSVSFMMNGLNISLSLYFALKTIRIAWRRRTPFWYILVTMHTALFLSVVTTVSDPLIWNACHGGMFSCFMYGLFYLCVTSVGFFRLYIVSQRKKMYLVGWGVCACAIVGSYGSLCGPMFIPLVLGQSLVEDAFMYEASMLLVNTATGSTKESVMKSATGSQLQLKSVPASNITNTIRSVATSRTMGGDLEMRNGGSGNLALDVVREHRESMTGDIVDSYGA
ncbi:hypothetical protein HDV00_010547 [Rhizophlyctis rosea]|nr:hypothetical protein HDV00_010547 [Rhizophlyctis rosea]